MEPSTYDIKVLIQLAWIALIALAIIIIPFTVVAAIAFKRAPTDKNPAFTFSQLFERAKALQMTTVILIVVAVVFLALFRVIDSNGAVGILRGYVLGGLQKESNRPLRKASEGQLGKER